MNIGVQNKFKVIGDYGCYLISMLKGLDKTEFDVITYYDILLQNKLISKDCTVQDSKGVMEYLVDKPVEYNYYSEKPKGEFNIIIEEWYNPRTKYTHFRLPNWDPLEDSVTVKEGFIRSWRTFKW